MGLTEVARIEGAVIVVVLAEEAMIRVALRRTKVELTEGAVTVVVLTEEALTEVTLASTQVELAMILARPQVELVLAAGQVIHERLSFDKRVKWDPNVSVLQIDFPNHRITGERARILAPVPFQSMKSG